MMMRIAFIRQIVSGKNELNFYPGAKNGWYLDAGGTIHDGVAAGVALGKTELVGRFGWLRTERYREMMPPLYASVGLGVGF